MESKKKYECTHDEDGSTECEDITSKKGGNNSSKRKSSNRKISKYNSSKRKRVNKKLSKNKSLKNMKGGGKLDMGYINCYKCNKNDKKMKCTRINVKDAFNQTQERLKKEHDKTIKYYFHDHNKALMKQYEDYVPSKEQIEKEKKKIKEDLEENLLNESAKAKEAARLEAERVAKVKQESLRKEQEATIISKIDDMRNKQIIDFNKNINNNKGGKKTRRRKQRKVKGKKSLKRKSFKKKISKRRNNKNRKKSKRKH